MRLRHLAAGFALTALVWAPFAVLGAGPASARASADSPQCSTSGPVIGWWVCWKSQGDLTPSTELSGHASYTTLGAGPSSNDVAATIQVTSDTVPSSCIGSAVIPLRQNGTGTDGLSNIGDFSLSTFPARCNGPYQVMLSASSSNPLVQPQSYGGHPTTSISYTHPSYPVATPTVAAGADGSSLVVSWAPPTNAAPDLVGYSVTRTYKPAAGGAAQVKTYDVKPDDHSYTDAVGTNYGGYQYTVKARYWGAAGPDSSELASAASAPVQASVSAPGHDGNPPTTSGGGSGGGTGSGGGSSTKPVIDTTPGATKKFFPIPNVPQTESANVVTPTVPTVPGSSSGTTEVPQDGQYDIPEPGGPQAVKPKTPLSAQTLVDHPTGGGLNGRTIAVVAASVLVLGLVAAQLTFLSRRAAALELSADDDDVVDGS